MCLVKSALLISKLGSFSIKIDLTDNLGQLKTPNKNEKNLYRKSLVANDD